MKRRDFMEVEATTKNITLRKVMFFLLMTVITGIACFYLYFIVTNIKSILVLIGLIVGLCLIGYAMFRIAYLLFGFILMIGGVVGLLALIGLIGGYLSGK